MWILLALLGYLLLATVFLLDKRILSSLTLSPIVYTFYSTVFLVVLFLLLPFTEVSLSLHVWFQAAVSGLTFLLALWSMFQAFKTSEVSHMGPFIGAFITVASFCLGALLLQEKLSSFQQLGIVVLVIASLLLSLEKTRSHSLFHSQYLWGVLSGLLFGLSNVEAKAVYESSPFLFGIIATKGMSGVFALSLLYSKQVRVSLFAKKKEKKKQKQKITVILTVVLNKILSVLANGLIQYAIAIGSVTMVTALGGIQYAFLFILVILFSRYHRSFFKEYMTTKEVSLQSFALVLMLIGVAFFAF